MTPVPVVISAMTQADLSGVWTIEQTLTGPWTYGQLMEELTLAHGWHLVARSSITTHDDSSRPPPMAMGSDCCLPGSPQSAPQDLVGYVFGCTIIDEAEIRKIAIAPEYRRQSIASQLLATVDRLLVASFVSECFLELRAANTAALALYQKNGFQIVGQRKNYYTMPTDDAILVKKAYNDWGQSGDPSAGQRP